MHRDGLRRSRRTPPPSHRVPHHRRRGRRRRRPLHRRGSLRPGLPHAQAHGALPRRQDHAHVDRPSASILAPQDATQDGEAAPPGAPHDDGERLVPRGGRQPQKQTPHRRIRRPNPASKSSTRDPQPWPEDEEAKAMFAAYFARRREDVSPETAKHQERYDARLRAARRRGERRRAHWMEPLLATTLAESFELPGWVVDYFRLVKMEATTDAPVANPPRSSATTTARATPGFPAGALQPLLHRRQGAKLGAVAGARQLGPRGGGRRSPARRRVGALPGRIDRRFSRVRHAPRTRAEELVEISTRTRALARVGPRARARTDGGRELGPGPSVVSKD